MNKYEGCLFRGSVLVGSLAETELQGGQLLLGQRFEAPEEHIRKLALTAVEI